MASAGSANQIAGAPAARARRRRRVVPATTVALAAWPCGWVVVTASLLLVGLVELLQQPVDVRLAAGELLHAGEVGRLDLGVRPLLVHERHRVAAGEERSERLYQLVHRGLPAADQRKLEVLVGVERGVVGLGEEVDELLRLRLVLAGRTDADAGAEARGDLQSGALVVGGEREDADVVAARGGVADLSRHGRDLYRHGGLALGDPRLLLLERRTVRAGVEVALLLQLQVALVDRPPAGVRERLLAGEHLLGEVRILGERGRRRDRVGDQLSHPRRLVADREGDLARRLDLVRVGEQVRPALRQALDAGLPEDLLVVDRADGRHARRPDVRLALVAEQRAQLVGNRLDPRCT